MLTEEILFEAFKNFGISNEVLEGIDLHSTVKISLPDELSIFISSGDDDIVWLWTRLNFVSDYHIQNNSYEMFMTLMEVKPLTMTGQYIFSNGDNGFELKAPLSNKISSSAENFSLALSRFIDDVVKLKESLT